MTDGRSLVVRGLGERVADDLRACRRADSRAQRRGVGGEIDRQQVAVELAGRRVCGTDTRVPNPAQPTDSDRPPMLAKP